MTGRERLVAALRGGDLDRPAMVLWGEGVADALVLPANAFPATPADHAQLARVASPFLRAREEGVDLNAIVSEDPSTTEVDRFAEATRSEMHVALENGADGIFYHLDGPRSSQCTPMQYGGLYLELDRDLLQEVREARAVLVWVEGEEELYLDALSDLPAHAMGWHFAASGFSAAQFKALRPGPTFGFDSTADIRLTRSADDAARFLQQEQVTA